MVKDQYMKRLLLHALLILSLLLLATTSIAATRACAVKELKELRVVTSIHDFAGVEVPANLTEITRNAIRKHYPEITFSDKSANTFFVTLTLLPSGDEYIYGVLKVKLTVGDASIENQAVFNGNSTIEKYTEFKLDQLLPSLLFKESR